MTFYVTMEEHELYQVPRVSVHVEMDTLDHHVQVNQILRFFLSSVKCIHYKIDLVFH